ncbi:MAG: sigma-70 family RNA polymerase sigma factor [Oligoflexia bacterium]|nr:sigma-70 family RNA polymerase sigma factor [Oligoflexia bacterium]
MKADIDLVKEVKAGDKAAYAELVKRHQKALYRLALRFTRDHGSAEDVVQDSLVKAYQKLHTFEERSSFKSWLFRIAINTSKNKLRAQSNTDLDIENVIVSVDSKVEADFEYKEVQGFINEEVQKLPDRQRMALTLRVFEDMSFQEIAQIMDCPYDTAKANYRHAVLKLKKVLTAKGGDDASRWLMPEENINSTINTEPNRE